MLIVRQRFMYLFHLLQHEFRSVPLRLMTQLKPRIETRDPATEECPDNNSNNTNPSVHHVASGTWQNYPLATARGSVSACFGFQRSPSFPAAAGFSRGAGP